MKHPLIIKSALVPKRFCVNIFGTLWTRDKSWIDRYVINHEKIHTRQQKELLFAGFYLLYIIEWLFRMLQYRNFQQAYLNISFEREAYSYGKDLDYLNRRQSYAWIRFVKKDKK